jgi:uncharacterized iron-regulated protein
MHAMPTMPTGRCRALLCLLMIACAPRPGMMQTAADGAAHPLAGRIWDIRTADWVSMTELERRLTGARYVLLGEVHDNPEHHQLRRDLLAALVREGRRPAIAMEQFDREHQAALQRVQNEPAPTPELLKTAGRLDAQGWNWSYYEPIVRLALDRRLPIVAANLSRSDAFRVSTEGAAAVLGAPDVAAMHLDQPLPDAARLKLEQVIEEGHCGQAPGDILPGMVAAQRARDAVMAHTLQAHAPAVLIAGNGHVRRDFGVPHDLAQYAQGDDVRVVGFVEVDDARPAPADYVTAAAPEYDYMVFTARTPREDPCKTLRFKPR